ncbi:MAG: AAA family ATPase [Gaiellaceae bacterium]
MSEVFGRDDEVAFVRAFLDGAGEGATALVLRGEAGIGKSTIWLAGVEHARAAGFRVLSCRPAEAERGLAHAGLGDVLEGILDDVLQELPAPRRRALEAALLVADAPGERIDDRALGVAVRTALETAARLGPVLIAIDDVQWLDAASADALAFALRRLDSDGVVVLLAQRTTGEVEPTPIEAALDPDDVRRLSVGPLSLGALHRLFRGRLGRPFARQTLVRIYERAAGNPFYALQIARLLGDDVDPLEPLPVPETLEELVREQLSSLPPATRRALALASAYGAPSDALYVSAGIPRRVLDRAVAAQVIERVNGTIRFTHPLLLGAVRRSRRPTCRCASAHLGAGRRSARACASPGVRSRYARCPGRRRARRGGEARRRAWRTRARRRARGAGATADAGLAGR